MADRTFRKINEGEEKKDILVSPSPVEQVATESTQVIPSVSESGINEGTADVVEKESSVVSRSRRGRKKKTEEKITHSRSFSSINFTEDVMDMFYSVKSKYLLSLGKRSMSHSDFVQILLLEFCKSHKINID